MIQIATRASEASLLNKKNYCFIIFIIKKIERKTSLSIMCKKKWQKPGCSPVNHFHLSCDMVYGMRITVAYDYLSDG